MQGLLGQLNGTHAMPIGNTNGQGLLAPVLQRLLDYRNPQPQQEMDPQAALAFARMFGLLDPSAFEGRR